MHFPVIVIGSGASGSAIAHELTQAGISCLMLEAGSHHPRASLPRSEIQWLPEIFWGGGLELDRKVRSGLMRGRAVGGSTLTYSAILYRYDEFVFDWWRQLSGVSFLNERELAPHYEAAETYVPMRRQNEGWNNPCNDIFRDGFEKKGYNVHAEMRGAGDCRTGEGNDCMACMGGCPIGSKASMPDTLLKQALRNGLKLLPDFEVARIERRPEGGAICHGVYQGRTRIRFTCDKLVLACAPVGNVKLLTQSGFADGLPALGENFYVHWQWWHCGEFEREIDGWTGLFQVYASTDMRLRKRGLKFENTFMPPGSFAAACPGYGADHLRTMRRYRNHSCIESAVRGMHPGRIDVRRDGSHTFDAGETDDEARRTDEARELAYSILADAGADNLWTTTYAACPHHFGGLNLSEDPRRGCVDPEFHLHGHRDIYCADSSVFPGSAGLNPALTIWALSHRASQQILKEMR